MLENKFIIHASSRTKDGLWILTPPCLPVPIDAGNEFLGNTVISSLDRSREGLPRPDNWKALLAPLLKSAGVRSWRAFARGAKHACVEESDGRLEVMPSKMDEEHSFIDQPERAVTIAVRDPGPLGEALRAALEEPASASGRTVT
jgi:hypothetical protein